MHLIALGVPSMEFTNIHPLQWFILCRCQYYIIAHIIHTSKYNNIKIICIIKRNNQDIINTQNIWNKTTIIKRVVLFFFFICNCFCEEIRFIIIYYIYKYAKWDWWTRKSAPNPATFFSGKFSVSSCRQRSSVRHKSSQRQRMCKKKNSKNKIESYVQNERENLGSYSASVFLEGGKFDARKNERSN